MGKIVDIYIDYLLDLAAYIKKNAQIANTTIFKDAKSGLGCSLYLEGVAIGDASPIRTGRDMLVALKLSAPLDNWKQLLQAMGRLEKIFMNCDTENNELKVKYHVTLGAWSRSEEDDNIVFENSLDIKCIRININE